MPLNKIFFIILSPLLFAACTHFPPPEQKQTLFPIGTYQHHIDLHIEQTSQNFQFQGVMNLTEKGLRIYMLGPMNVSAVKISEIFPSPSLSLSPSAAVKPEIKIENNLEQFKPYEGKMKSLYFILRSFILFPKDKESWAALKVVKRDDAGNILLFNGPAGIEIEIKKYRGATPIVFEIRQPKFLATVKELSL